MNSQNKFQLRCIIFCPALSLTHAHVHTHAHEHTPNKISPWVNIVAAPPAVTGDSSLSLSLSLAFMWEGETHRSTDPSRDILTTLKQMEKNMKTHSSTILSELNYRNKGISCRNIRIYLSYSSHIRVVSEPANGTDMYHFTLYLAAKKL